MAERRQHQTNFSLQHLCISLQLPDDNQWSSADDGVFSTLTVLYECGAWVLAAPESDHLRLILWQAVFAELMSWSWWVHPGRVNPV